MYCAKYVVGIHGGCFHELVLLESTKTDNLIIPI
jgi:hypothetical protein